MDVPLPFHQDFFSQVTGFIQMKDKPNIVLVVDAFHHIIRKIDRKSIVAGAPIVAGVFNESGNEDGSAESSKFHIPYSITVDWNQAPNKAYISQPAKNNIRTMTFERDNLTPHMVATLGSDLHFPRGLAVVANILYIGAQGVFHYFPFETRIETAGWFVEPAVLFHDGHWTKATFGDVTDILVYRYNFLLIADNGNEALRWIDRNTKVVSTISCLLCRKLYSLSLFDENTILVGTEDGIFELSGEQHLCSNFPNHSKYCILN